MQALRKGRRLCTLQSANIFPGALYRRTELQISDISGIGLGLQEELDATVGVAADQRQHPAFGLGQDRLIPPGNLSHAGRALDPYALDAEELAARMADVA